MIIIKMNSQIKNIIFALGLMILSSSSVLLADDNPAKVELLMPDSFLLGDTDYQYVSSIWYLSKNDAFDTFILPGVPPTVPATYNDFRAMLRDIAPHLSSSGKFSALSWLGVRLLSGYDGNEPEYPVPMEKVYQNMLQDGHFGGVCKDIHAALLDFASDLGFKNNVGQGSLANGGAHAYDMIQNPDNLHWYLLNYYYFVDTGSQEYYKAADLASRHLGQLSTIAVFAHNGNSAHLFQDRPTQWAAELLDNFSQFDLQPTEKPRFQGSFELNFKGQTVSLQYGDQNLKIYAVESSYAAREGVYDVNAIGAVENYAGDKRFIGPTRIGIDEHINAGYLNFTSPDINDNPGTHTSTINFYYLTQLKIWIGSDKIRVFGETKWDGLDYRKTDDINYGNSTSYNETRLGFELGLLQKKLLIEGGRTFQVNSETMNDNNAVGFIKEDYIKGKLNFAVDINDKTKLYIVSETTFYVFDGLDKKSAMGVMELIKASIPSEHLGTFTVIADASALFNQTIQGNGLPDPFFQQDHTFIGLTAEWKKEIWTNTALGAQVRVVSGVEPHPVFHDNLFATPELYQMDAPNTLSLQGKVFISRKF